MKGNRFLYALVFVVGAASLGTEIAVARLMEPFFGASTIIWANTIATVLVALSVGYEVGGRLADRRADIRALCVIVTIAGVLLAPVLLIAVGDRGGNRAQAPIARVFPLLARKPAFWLIAFAALLVSDNCIFRREPNERPLMFSALTQSPTKRRPWYLRPLIVSAFGTTVFEIRPMAQRRESGRSSGGMPQLVLSRMRSL